jgi:hypothetical protein
MVIKKEKLKKCIVIKTHRLENNSINSKTNKTFSLKKVRMPNDFTGVLGIACG